MRNYASLFSSPAISSFLNCSFENIRHKTRLTGNSHKHRNTRTEWSFPDSPNDVKTKQLVN